MPFAGATAAAVLDDVALEALALFATWLLDVALDTEELAVTGGLVVVVAAVELAVGMTVEAALLAVDDAAVVPGDAAVVTCDAVATLEPDVAVVLTVPPQAASTPIAPTVLPARTNSCSAARRESDGNRAEAGSMAYSYGSPVPTERRPATLSYGLSSSPTGGSRLTVTDRMPARSVTPIISAALATNR